MVQPTNTPRRETKTQGTLGKVKAYLHREMTYQARRGLSPDRHAKASGDLKTVLSLIKVPAVFDSKKSPKCYLVDLGMRTDGVRCQAILRHTAIFLNPALFGHFFC